MDLQVDSFADSFAHALFGAIIVLCLIIVGLLSINLWNRSIALQWVPVMGLVLWPRYAVPFTSVIFIFLLGLLQDIASAQTLGFSSMAYLLIYGALRPRVILDKLPMTMFWMRFTGAILLILLLGFILGGATSFVSVQTVGIQFVVTVLIFPVFFQLRLWLADRLINHSRL